MVSELSYWSILRLMIALFVPWVLGSLWVSYIGAEKKKSNIGVILGYGYFLGTFITILILRLWSYIEIRQSFWAQIGVLFLLATIGYMYVYIFSSKKKEAKIISTIELRHPVWMTFLWIVFVFLLVIRFCFLSFELFERPLYPWDAWWHWASRAKIWFEWNELVPIVDANTWLSSHDMKVYTVDGYYKPVSVSLLTYWVASGLGYWNDVLINIPWLMCGIALMLAFYGQLRQWGIHSLPAIVTTYLLFSMPYLNVHVELAGYADIWVASTYVLATMSFLHWVRRKSSREAILACLMVAFLIMLKLPGVIWALSFIVALFGALFFRKMVLVVLLFIGVVVAGVLYLDKLSINIPLLGIVDYQSGWLSIGSTVRTQMSFHNVSEAFFRTGLVFGNWHLMLIVLIIGLMIYMVKEGSNQAQRAASILVAYFSATMFALFSFTDWYMWADDQTTINRMILQGIPTLLFSVVVLVWPTGHEKERC